MFETLPTPIDSLGMTLECARAFEAKVMIEPNSGCWLWTAALDGRGYAAFTIDGKSWRGHRLSFRLYRGRIPNDLCVLHKCDTRPCINPAHIFLGTEQDNSDDMKAKGRSPKHVPPGVFPVFVRGKKGDLHNTAGENNWISKLTDQQVLEIRATPGPSHQELAGRYGVSRRTIRDIRSGRAWTHLLPSTGQAGAN